MEIELAATHEAGHAVMQWLVGWEVIELQMTVSDSNATKAFTRCPNSSLDIPSDLRKRLLVMFAGNAVTLRKWAGRWNDRGDWLDVGLAFFRHFKRPIKWVPMEGKAVKDAEANAVMQTALAYCNEIVAHPAISPATERIAWAFMAGTPNERGVVLLPGAKAVSICQAEIGDVFRQTNPWAEWIAGK